MRIGFLITGRMKSTRLPLKLTLKIFDREMIALMTDRLKQSEILDEIIIATSTNSQDDVLEEIAIREEIGFFRGSEDDVVERLYGASVKYSLDYMINITADCPLVGYDLLPLLMDAYRKTDADLITCLNLPHGAFFYGIKPYAMKKVLSIKDTIDTEVWGGYFTDTGLFNCIELEVPDELTGKGHRWTLDYQEDFDFFETLYHAYGKEIIQATTAEIVNFLDERPEIVAINKDAHRKYQQRWDSQKNVKLK